MKSIQTYAQDLLTSYISVIPVNKDKKPIISTWSEYQDGLMTLEKAETSFRSAYGVAVICGKVSGGMECIDFDAHDHDIQAIFREWGSEQGVTDIVKRNKLYIEQSPRGGYHIMYRYESDRYEGNQVLARWEDGTTMIETRAEGGYVVISPTPDYKVLRNGLTQLATITEEERDYLISYAKQFNRNQKPIETDIDADTGYDHTDPISWFNWNKASYAKRLLEEKGWVKIQDKDDIEYWRRPGKTEGTSASWGKKHNALYCFSTSVEYFKPECYYTPFQILVRLRFQNNYYAAFNWVISKYFDSDNPYIRVGVDYYKKIRKIDRFGLYRTELKAWKKDEIKQDEGKGYLDRIPRFDDFTIEPDNFHYHPVIQNCYNLYKEFSHKPIQGDWRWSRIMLEHIFGEQYDLGLRYLQALYLHPNRMLPILVLVSKERQTGKTTFLNWLNMIFGDNMANIAPEDLAGSFNHLYATSNIIAIEETLIEKSLTVEKLKALATGKFISVNQKWVQQYKIPFYGKIILASNNEDKFARIDEEEIRFFVRKVEMPSVMNHSIEENLQSEIPAFLYYLTTLPPIDWSKDRSGFTPQEISNETLRAVKQESRTWLYKELHELITDFFNNNDVKEIFAIPSDIKNKWYLHNSKVDVPFIRQVLKNEFHMTPMPMMRYVPLGGYGYDVATKVGSPYQFSRSAFTDAVPVPVPVHDGDFVKNFDSVNNDDLPF